MKEPHKNKAIPSDGNNHKKELEELRQKCEEYLNGWKRAQADYQNLIKETAKQKEFFIKAANENLILDLIPVLDNFKIAFCQIPKEKENSAWVIGFNHIKKQLEELLCGFGLEEIKTIGAKFNLLEHEAVGEKLVEDKADGVIIEEKKPGYKLNGKVVQVAKVVVNLLQNNQNNK